MSVHVLSWVLRHSPAEKSDRLVLLVLADNADEERQRAWPSVETIRLRARLRSRRSVQESLRVLEKAAAVRPVDEHPSGTTVYRVSMDLAEQGWAGIYPDFPGGAKTAPPAISARANDDAGGRKNQPGGGAKNAPKPSGGTTPEPSRAHTHGRPAKWVRWVDEHVPDLPRDLALTAAMALDMAGPTALTPERVRERVLRQYPTLAEDLANADEAA